LDTFIIHTPLAYLSDVFDKWNGCTTSLHGGDNILPHSGKIVYYKSLTVAEQSVKCKVRHVAYFEALY